MISRNETEFEQIQKVQEDYIRELESVRDQTVSLSKKVEGEGNKGTDEFLEQATALSEAAKKQEGALNRRKRDEPGKLSSYKDLLDEVSDLAVQSKAYAPKVEGKEDEKEEEKVIEKPYKDQIAILKEIGFNDEEEVVKALSQNNGDFTASLDLLIAQRKAKEQPE